MQYSLNIPTSVRLCVSVCTCTKLTKCHTGANNTSVSAMCANQKPQWQNDDTTEWFIVSFELIFLPFCFCSVCTVFPILPAPQSAVRGTRLHFDSNKRKKNSCKLLWHYVMDEPLYDITAVFFTNQERSPKTSGCSWCVAEDVGIAVAYGNKYCCPVSVQTAVMCVVYSIISEPPAVRESSYRSVIFRQIQYTVQIECLFDGFFNKYDVMTAVQHSCTAGFRRSSYTKLLVGISS